MTILHSLTLKDFRNYTHEKIVFKGPITPLIGDNGQGKTALLEAIFILSCGRSFRTTKLTDCIRYGCSSFSLHANFYNNEVSQELSISYNEKGKKISHGSTQFNTFTALLGLIKTVAITPLDIELIHNNPLLRRRWLDLHLTQNDPVYLYQLAKYSRALKQRNSLLKQNTLDTIDLFEKQMVEAGIYISKKRIGMLQEMKKKAQKQYTTLSQTDDIIDLEHLHYKKNFEEVLINNRKKELIYGYTLEGPHREDVHFCFNGYAAKSHASEGQKRLILLSIKLAELSILDQPLLIIDDLGTHLDNKKQQILLKLIQSLPQVVYSSQFKPVDKEYFIVKKGSINEGSGIRDSNP